MSDAELSDRQLASDKHNALVRESDNDAAQIHLRCRINGTIKVATTAASMCTPTWCALLCHDGGNAEGRNTLRNVPQL